MRQRASIKTQRRLKQQQVCNPYALTDDVYYETPQFQLNGLVTAVGALRLVAVLALSCFVFGNTLLFCAVLLTTLGIVILHRIDNKVGTQGLGLKHAINRLLVLRRSALDYSLTLSIAQSDKQMQKKELQIATLPSSPTPQKIVATMVLKEEEVLRTERNNTTKHLVDIALPTILNRVPLSIASLLIMEKPRANSEPKQVLRSRPLLPLKAKVQNVGPAQEKTTTTQERLTPIVLKTLAEQEKKSTHVRAKAKMMQSQQKKTAPKASKVSSKKYNPLPAMLPASESNVAIPAVLSMANHLVKRPQPKVTETDSSVATGNVELLASAVVPVPVFPKCKPLVEIANGEAAIERDVICTRKVLICLNTNLDSSVNVEEQNLEQESECNQDVELGHKAEEFDVSLETFPPLSPPMVPMSLPTNVEEPNFLLDIELEPIAEPGETLTSLSLFHVESVGSVDLRSMIDELDAMRLELDAAMACCTSLLDDGEKASMLTIRKLKLEEDLICCW